MFTVLMFNMMMMMSRSIDFPSLVQGYSASLTELIELRKENHELQSEVKYNSS